MFTAPQTPDGWIRRVTRASDGVFTAEVGFPSTAAMRELVLGQEEHIRFAARSRLARLGINVVPLDDARPTLDGEDYVLPVTVNAMVSAYNVAPLLEHVIQPGLRAGRLVFCPPERRLRSEEIDQAILDNELQLPASYSIDHGGHFRIRPHGHVYDLLEPLTKDVLTTIAVREDGKDVLNRLQVRRPVDRIVLAPGDGVITSCSMFLHKHYVVLESDATPLGQHLEAVVLDPITTRGTNIFLEFHNSTDHRIVNPAASAALYRAAELPPRTHYWQGVDLADDASSSVQAQRGGATAEYMALSKLFDRLENNQEAGRYSHRLVAITDDIGAMLDGEDPAVWWQHPERPLQPSEGGDRTARHRAGRLRLPYRGPFGTNALADLPDGAGVTLLLGYFPNLVEHAEISAAAVRKKVKRVIFRRASYEHGGFLSARDHGRLADYEGLEVEVYWCNDERGHVVRHIFRGLRGYFMEPQNVDRFRKSLIFAAYGSSKPLNVKTQDRVERLIENLHTMFGDDIAIITGGGPGAMQQATDIARERGLLVGASFIETVDQKTNQVAEFYQTFQGRSRQARQRWFEIASFHLFFTGGVGTLEEVGLTLTDMKLGVIELSPLVFFGEHKKGPYWRALRKQFSVMMDQKRAPDWLESHVLMTHDPDAVPAFYKRVLDLA